MDVIVSVRKARGRYQLALESGEVFEVSGAIFRERPLSEGDVIDAEEFERWLMPRQYREALDYAVSLLAMRAWARGELERKLVDRRYRPGVIEMVIYKLEREGLLDDADFARQWVEARAGRRLGPRRIAGELRRKGVDPGDIEDALGEMDGERVLEDALALARKGFARAKSGEDPRKTAQRVAGMLARRGFDWEVIREVIGKCSEE